jgi:archaellum component FlaC
MDYEKMSNSELENELKTVENDFNGYKKLLKEVYEGMSELSDKYNNIKQILDNRNGR